MKTIICPNCGKEINPLDEDYFKDDFISDAGYSEIQCLSCRVSISLKTILDITFEIVEEWET